MIQNLIPALQALSQIISCQNFWPGWMKESFLLLLLLLFWFYYYCLFRDALCHMYLCQQYNCWLTIPVSALMCSDMLLPWLTFSSLKKKNQPPNHQIKQENETTTKEHCMRFLCWRKKEQKTEEQGSTKCLKSVKIQELSHRVLGWVSNWSCCVFPWK